MHVSIYDIYVYAHQIAIAFIENLISFLHLLLVITVDKINVITVFYL